MVQFICQLSKQTVCNVRLAMLMFGHSHTMLGAQTMTTLEFLLNQKDWCAKWLATPEDQLPGSLTHKKIMQVNIETELSLIDHERYDAYGKMHYV